MHRCITSLCRPTYRRRHEQDKMQYRERLCVEASHIMLLILRKSSIILIANFSPRLPTLVIVYTGTIHLLPLKTYAHCSYSLRKRKHYYQLPNVECSQYKNCFINRCLFKFRWLFSVCFVLFLMFCVFL